MKRGFKKGLFYFGKEGQIWIETVVYTLIAMTLIGAVLAFVLPKIQDIQDKAVIEQSITVLEDINSIILSVVQGGAGNKRVVNLGIKQGEFSIDGVDDRLFFEIETGYDYSEIGEDRNIGNVVVRTDKTGGLNKVTLTGNYNNYDITYETAGIIKKVGKSSTPYKLSIENKGESDGEVVIDMSIQ